MKTSKLLCIILHNEGEIEFNSISRYVKILVQKGYIETNGTKIKLTDKGKKYHFLYSSIFNHNI